jgi:hypothetical protein
MVVMARLAAVLVALTAMAGGVIFLVAHHSPPNACGAPPFTAAFARRHVALTGCDGELAPPAAGITLMTGESVTVGKTAIWSGFFSSDPAILARRSSGARGTVFTAMGRGVAVIEVKARGSCASRASATTCNVLGVTVSS